MAEPQVTFDPKTAVPINPSQPAPVVKQAPPQGVTFNPATATSIDGSTKGMAGATDTSAEDAMAGITGFETPSNPAAAIGFAKSAAETVVRPATWAAEKVGLMQPESRTALLAKLERHGVPEKIGAGVEQVAELLVGGEALKAMSLTEHLTSLTKVAKLMEEYPALGRLAHTAVTNVPQAAMMGAQDLAHGASPGEAATTAGITAGVPLAAEGLSAAAKGVSKLGLNSFVQKGLKSAENWVEKANIAYEDAKADPFGDQEKVHKLYQDLQYRQAMLDTIEKFSTDPGAKALLKGQLKLAAALGSGSIDEFKKLLNHAAWAAGGMVAAHYMLPEKLEPYADLIAAYYGLPGKEELKGVETDTMNWLREGGASKAVHEAGYHASEILRKYAPLARDAYKYIHSALRDQGVPEAAAVEAPAETATLGSLDEAMKPPGIVKQITKGKEAVSLLSGK